MNRWFALLRESPPQLQRLIARTQRVSLPRGCDTDERLRRLRRALCSAAAVRSAYATLDAATRDAVETLRQRRGSIPAAELTASCGSLRSYRQIAKAPSPVSVAERLLLLGWLLPRRSAAQQATEYLLAPEVRRWLPKPLVLGSRGAAPAAPYAPALRAAVTILLVCASTPLAVRADGFFRRNALRVLAPLLALDASAVGDLCAFVLPLLVRMGLVSLHRGRCTATPGAAAFFAQSESEQRDRLVNAWIADPTPDRWLRRMRLALSGVDWPLLRRRLLYWIGLIPADRLVNSDGLYDALAATLGPLVDAQTHGFRTIRRTPWQPRNAARAFLTALSGPLDWLGAVAWHDGCVYRPGVASVGHTAWRYGANNDVIVPFAGVDGDALALTPYGRWVCGDQAKLTFRIQDSPAAPGMIARHPNRLNLHELLMRRTGSTPDGWDSALVDTTSRLRFVDGVLIIADNPAALNRATRARTVRRYLRVRPAPGVAVTQHHDAAKLRRALVGQGFDVIGDTPPMPRPDAPPDQLTPGDCAALLAACAFYRRHAPATMPLLINDELETRLRKTLSPALHSALETAIAQIDKPVGAPPVKELVVDQCSMASDAENAWNAAIGLSAMTSVIESVETIPSIADPGSLHVLRTALRRSALVTIDYDTGGTGISRRRTIRPLELEQRGETWYLRAYCMQRHAERTFRVDRIRQLE